MKIAVKCTIVAISLWLIVNSTAAANEENSTNTTSSNENQTAKKPHPLCARCNCNTEQRTFDCSSRKLHGLFNTVDWATLNNSGVATDTMILSRNNIPEVPQFPQFDVKVLDLSYNNISIIAKKAFYHLMNLEVLDLSYNMLTRKAMIPEIFEGSYNLDLYLPLGKMRILRLGNNNMNSLDADLFQHLPNLEELSLTGNMFNPWDPSSTIAIGNLMWLRMLDLSYMELQKIPFKLFILPQELWYVNLTGNLLTTIPDALGDATNLKWLSLDENPIQRIQGDHIFPSLKTLEYLSISNMSQLKIIGRGAFSKLERLQEVQICNNPSLTHLHKEAFSHAKDEDDPVRLEWPRIKKLYLNNNNLSRLDSQLLTEWDDMEVIDIRFNPWQCDRDNQWMMETLIPILKKKTPKHMNSVVCASPHQTNGLLMQDLDHKQSQMCCLDKDINDPKNDDALQISLLIGILALAGIMLTAAVILIYKRGCFGLFPKVDYRPIKIADSTVIKS